MLRTLGVLGLATLMASFPAQAKKEAKYVPPVPLTPEQAALVEKAVTRELAIVRLIRRTTPVVQTYIQNMRPDPKLQMVPASDEYIVARVDFGKAFVANPNEARSRPFFNNSLEFLRDLTKRFNLNGSGTSFMDMMFLDPTSFDQQQYDFTSVRRDFLGGVRTLVFDVRPKPKEGNGRFFGRIWIEDQDGNIVRFNGSYTGNKEDQVARYYHFDSWRVNVQPDVWLPTAIYVEETAQSQAQHATGLRAQTYFWGYSLKLPTRESDAESVQVEHAQDQSDRSQDLSPLQAHRQWVSQAEQNVLDRLTQAGLLAPPSDFDKVLETVTNNIIIGNKLTLPDDIHCRVLLTTPLESLAVGNTILISKGLADVLPSEESLAAILSFQLAHIVMGHHIDTRDAFNNRLLFPDEATFRRFNMNHSALDNQAAAKKAVELFNNSVYKDKSASVGLFFQALQAEEKQVPYLLTPRLGDSLIKADGTPWLAALGNGAPKLDMDNLTQIAALPLNSRLKIDPWDDKVTLLNVKAAPLLSARDKVSFQVTPIYYRLQKYQPLSLHPDTKETSPLAANTDQNLPPPVRLDRAKESNATATQPEGQHHAANLNVPIFPWPPPAFSSKYVIPRELITAQRPAFDLDDVNHILVDALFQNGYSDLSYFPTPGRGFILVTRIEYTKDDGTPMPGDSRWSLTHPLSLKDFTISKYLAALFLSPPGYYRVVVFAITDLPIFSSRKIARESDTKAWSQDGSNELPDWIGNDHYTANISCTALIYEFKVANDKALNEVPGHLDGETHLRKAGLLNSLGGK